MLDVAFYCRSFFSFAPSLASSAFTQQKKQNNTILIPKLSLHKTKAIAEKALANHNHKVLW
jgi:hypothetical protein